MPFAHLNLCSKKHEETNVFEFYCRYKSTLQCPRCHYISIKFDPFMYLSLPLPSPKRRTFVLTAVDQFNSIAPIEIGVRISKRASIRDLLKEVARVYSEHYQISSNESEWALTQWNGTKLEVFSNAEVRLAMPISRHLLRMHFPLITFGII